MRGITGSLSRGRLAGTLPLAQQGQSTAGGDNRQAVQSYSGRVSTPFEGLGAGVSDRTIGSPVVASETQAVPGQGNRAAFSMPSSGFGQQTLPGGRLGSTAFDRTPELPRQRFGTRGTLAADQDYEALLGRSRSQYDTARSTALASFGEQVGEDRTAYDAQVAAARAAHDAQYAPLTESARTAYDTQTSLADSAYQQRARSAENQYNYVRSRPSHTSFTPNFIRGVVDEYQNTRAPFQPDPFVSPAPAFQAQPFDGPEFTYPEFVPPERESQYVAPSGTPVVPPSPTFNPQALPENVPQGVQWYSAYGGYHFQPQDILSENDNQIVAQATRYNGYRNTRTFPRQRVYEQSAPLTPEAIRNNDVYRGTIL